MEIVVGSQEWLEARRQYITATDACVIMEVSPWKTRLQLYRQKIEGTEIAQNEAMKRGLALEPRALEIFQTVTGHFVRPKFVVSEWYTYMAASFDGISDDNQIVVEVKCPGERDHSIAKNGQVPEKYFPQLQHQMVVANTDRAFYFSYRPVRDDEPGIINAEEFAIIEVKQDIQYQDKMMEKELDFFAALRDKTPPEPGVRDMVTREDREWLMVEEELYHLMYKMQEDDARREYLRDRLIQMSGDRPTMGYRMKAFPVGRKGQVDYKEIPELKGVDLEKYRKPVQMGWRVTQK